jgi:DNA-binding transcriptional regulator YiaG
MSTTTDNAAENLPYALDLGAGRTLVIELTPAEYGHDVDGDLVFTPAGCRRLDKARAAAVDMPDDPSPGWIKSFRAALGLTQAELAAALNVDKLTVSRWERGAVRPRLAAVRAMRQLRKKAARLGMVVA